MVRLRPLSTPVRAAFYLTFVALFLSLSIAAGLQARAPVPGTDPEADTLEAAPEGVLPANQCPTEW